MTDPGVTRLVAHPLVAHRMGELRDRRTGSDRFRVLMAEVSQYLAYEALHDLPTASVVVDTPLAPTPVTTVTDRVLIVPVLRAGLGMVPGIQAALPHTEVAHLGMRRDETTLTAITYLDGLPAELRGRRVVVCDPMLATGGSLIEACRLVERRHPATLSAIAVVASRPGLERLREAFPRLDLTCAAIDERLDERGYIVPGLGDAGDRLFGAPPT
jgi:uracil phosphoribosyltransferase